MARILLLLVVLGCLAAAPANAAPPRTLRLVSAGLGPVDASIVAISAGAERAVFATTESLVGDDQNTRLDYYARDQDGVVALISDGLAGPGAPSALQISSDGARAWFVTPGPLLPLADTDGSADVYERGPAGLRLISAGNDPLDADLVGGADDGSSVVFATSEAVPGTGDLDGMRDLFVRRADGVVALLTVGTAAPTVAAEVAPDGSRAQFTTSDVLAPGDDDPAADRYSVPIAGGTYTLVTAGTGLVDAHVSTPDLVTTWFTVGGSTYVSSGGAVTLIAAATILGATDDARRLFIETTAALDPANDGDAQPDVYERRIDGTFRLATPGTAAAPAFRGATSDGVVVVATTEALVPDDLDGLSDLYRFGITGPPTLLTGGVGAFNAIFATSRNVAATRLLLDLDIDVPAAGDGNEQPDAYEIGAESFRPAAGGLAAGSSALPITVTPDGSRLLVTTTTAVAGSGDGDAAVDVYEASFAAPAYEYAPTLTGTARVGRTLTCGPAPVDGEGVTASATAWLRNGVPIADATEPVRRVVAADAGADLSCRVSATNAIATTTADSPLVRIAPRALSSSLTGSPIVGTTVRCPRFAGASSVSYRWLRGARTIAGARSRSRRVRAADLGRRLTCRATAASGSASTIVDARLTIPGRCVVPYVLGLPASDARTALARRGCRSRTVRAGGIGVLPGLALGTTPGAGSSLRNGARVTVRIRR